MRSKLLNMMAFFSIFLWISGIECSAEEMEVHPLNFRVLDTEYSKALGVLIMVSTTPTKAVHIYDPRSETDISVTLPLSPTCVSVSPDGLYAAIGHDAWISYVNLTTASVEKTISVSCDVADIVLAGNGYVYAFPRRDQWEKIRCINIDTEIESLSLGNYIYDETLAKLHPNGNVIYGADNGLSPSDIEKYSIENGTADYLYDSPYHGDFAMCGDLWISQDGFRIFTRCGNVFRSSDIRQEDMVYNGSLSELSRIENLSHSLESNKVVVIPEGSQDTEIQIYDYDFLAFEDSTALPGFPAGDSVYSSHGRFVYYNDDGSAFYVIVQADSAAGLLYDFGIVTFGLEGDGPIVDTDSDGIPDNTDNCPLDYNPDQSDQDGEGIGDLCDEDTIHGTISSDIPGNLIVGLYRPSCGVSTLLDTTQTSLSGYYAFGNLNNGTYMIVPHHFNYSFVPESDTVLIPQTEIQSYDFTAFTLDLDGDGKINYLSGCSNLDGNCDFDDSQYDGNIIAVVQDDGSSEELRTYADIDFNAVTPVFHPTRDQTFDYCSNLTWAGNSAWKPLDEHDAWKLASANYPFDTNCASYDSFGCDIFSTSWDPRSPWEAPPEPWQSKLDLSQLYNSNWYRNWQLIGCNGREISEDCTVWFRIQESDRYEQTKFETDPRWPDTKPMVICKGTM